MKVKMAAVVVAALLGVGILGASVASADSGSPAPVGTPTAH